MTYQREGDDLVKSNGFEKEGDTDKVEVEFIAGVIKRAGENTPLPPNNFGRKPEYTYKSPPSERNKQCTLAK